MLETKQMSDLNQIEIMYKKELENRKQNIRKSMGTVAGELVKIGFELKKIRDGQLYVYDDCKNIYEFAEKEFHMDRTMASKMMKLNDTYSVDGYSEQIKEHLEEKLNSLGKTLLIEMMYLPEEDYDLITPDTKVTDIRELKNAENEGETQLPGQMDLLNSMPEIVPESEKSQKEITMSDVIRELFRPREMKEYLDALVNMDPDSQSMEWWVNDFNQSNNRTYKKIPFFLFFYSLTDGMKIKDIKTGSIETKTYKDFYFMARAAFAKETASGTDVWNKAFGEEYEAEMRRQKEEEQRKQDEEKRKKEFQKQKEEKQYKAKGNQEKAASNEIKNIAAEKKEEEELKKIDENSDFDNKNEVSDNDNEEIETENEKIVTENPEIVTGEVEDSENGLCDIAQEWEFTNTEKLPRNTYNEIVTGKRRHFVSNFELREGSRIRFTPTLQEKKEIRAVITVMDEIMGTAMNVYGFEVIGIVEEE